MSGLEASDNAAARGGPRQAAWFFRQNALWEIPSLFGRLVAVASCLDHATGRYVHRETAQLFGADETERVLRLIHAEVFSKWLALNLERQMAELEQHIASLGAEKRAVVRLWARAKPFRDLAPPTALDMERRLYLTDLDALMEVLKHECGLCTPQHEDDDEIVMSPEGVLCTRRLMRAWNW